MTVEELIARIIDAYQGATPEAMKSFKPVFLARLKHREGDKLDEATIEVFGSFKPKASQPFPIPADFEAHLPSLRDIKSGASPIGKMLEERHQRTRKLFEEWHTGQGLKIKSARPKHVYGACALEVYERAKRAKSDIDQVILNAEDITRCEQSAVTSERIYRFGAMPQSPEIWQTQCDEIRAEWAK
jgi:hypothetical protein